MFSIGIATIISNFILHVITELGYPGIFLLMVMEGALLPIPSEVIMAFGGYLVFSNTLGPVFGIPAFIVLLLAGTLGNVVGAYLAYMLGDYGGIPIILKYGKFFFLDRKSIDKTQVWFEKYGSLSVFFTRLTPIFRTFISIPAGIAKMNRLHFIVLTFVGSLIWDTILIYFGYILGPHWEQILGFFDELTIVALVVGAVIVIWWLSTEFKKRSRIKKLKEKRVQDRGNAMERK